MIQLTRLDGKIFTLNAIYIEKIQSLPDTTITLINGKQYFVRESESIVVEKVNEFYQNIGLIRIPVNKEGSSNEC
jgi:flagellar protein FlbD